jgi:hypothetical protein
MYVESILCITSRNSSMWKLQCCNATVLSVNDVSSRENRLWSLSNKIEKNKALHSSEAINYVHLQRINATNRCK